jgi:hypothetical protein
MLLELGPHNIQPQIRPLELAELLWEYGEDRVAEKAAEFDQSDLDRTSELAAWHCLRNFETGEDRSETRPQDKWLLAAIEYVEGVPRPPKRKRRRKRPPGERYSRLNHDPRFDFHPTMRPRDPDLFEPPAWFGSRCLMRID